jgi:hypothetical protein
MIKVNLSEDPREWRRFTLQFVAVMSGLLLVFGSRHSFGPPAALGSATLLLALAGLAIAQPRSLRVFYRSIMMVSERMGAIVTPVILTGLFFIVVAPTAWILRICGYDPLLLRPRHSASTYWRTASKPSRLDQMF